VRWLQSILDSNETVPNLAEVASTASVLYHHAGELDRALAPGEQALALRRASGDPLAIAESLSNLGTLQLERGEYAQARARLEESVELRRASGTRLAESLINLGAAALYDLDPDRCTEFCTEALRLMRQTGGSWAVAAALDNLGLAAYQRGDLAAAERGLEDSLVRWRELGHTSGIARALEYLGRVTWARGDVRGAEVQLRESLRLVWQVNDRGTMPDVLESYARCLPHDPARAARYLGAAEALREHEAIKLHAQDRPWVDGLVAWLDAQPEAPAIRRARLEGRSVPLADLVRETLEAAPSGETAP
jgi:tetratricopeptide (TPR) repeat protein